MAYVYHVNSSGKNISNVQKTRKALPDARNEIGLEETNALMSRQLDQVQYTWGLPSLDHLKIQEDQISEKDS
jgi:hypothetical protein